MGCYLGKFDFNVHPELFEYFLAHFFAVEGKGTKTRCVDVDVECSDCKPGIEMLWK
jgi:hypothetical protein